MTERIDRQKRIELLQTQEQQLRNQVCYLWVCVVLSSCVLRVMYMRVMYLCAAKSIKRLHDVCLHVLDLLGQGEDLSVDIRCFSCCVVNTFVMCEFNVIIIKSKYPMHSSKVWRSNSNLHLSLCIHTCLCEHIEKELSWSSMLITRSFRATPSFVGPRLSQNTVV